MYFFLCENFGTLFWMVNPTSCQTKLGKLIVKMMHGTLQSKNMRGFSCKQTPIEWHLSIPNIDDRTLFTFRQTLKT